MRWAKRGRPARRGPAVERTLALVTNALPTPSRPSPLDRDALLQRVDAALAAVVDRQLNALGFLGAEREPVASSLRGFVLRGGKRIRPAFLYWGYRGAGGPGGTAADPVVRAACAVELLHVCALIHDDIMDGSRVRRGRPSVHVEFSELHRGANWRGDPDAFGEGAAILMGDLAFTWADAALSAAGLPADRLVAALEVFNTLRSEMMGGQYLDLLEAQRGEVDEAAVHRVLLYKSGKYTIERPLHMGAALALGPDSARRAALARVYSAYGLPLGEAFQLRDDILGVFGSADVTGKPAGDDLREGKETFLVLQTRRRTDAAGRRLLEAGLGDAKLSDDAVAAIREVIASSGALEETEARITTLVREAVAAIDDPLVDPEAAGTLVELASFVTDRSA
jgi:geranylgeranyl diphosphate synthase type I